METLRVLYVPLVLPMFGQKPYGPSDPKQHRAVTRVLS